MNSGNFRRRRLWLRLRRVREIPGLPQRLADPVFNRGFRACYKVVREFTLLGYPRCRSLFSAVLEAVAKQIPGGVVECGAAAGGSAALMGLALKQIGAERRLYVFDTFEGLPPPSAEDPDFDVAVGYTGRCLGRIEQVDNLFKQLGLSNYKLVKGLFQDTLPVADTGPIAVLHLNGDWYESTMCCLENLWDRVSPGGILQIDDYGFWKGCRKAVDEFIKRRKIEASLRYIDVSGRRLIKPLRSEGYRDLAAARQ
ncbi:MAG: TylF/MycF/NovP-related O-methyltransferase [Candidatus Binataceae bacterium]